MAIDISEQLESIAGDDLLSEVRSSITEGASIISDATGINIDAELLTIATGRYGIDIRDAIHDALWKLAYGTPEPQSGLPPVDAIVCADVIQSIAATVYVESKEEG